MAGIIIVGAAYLVGMPISTYWTGYFDGALQIEERVSWVPVVLWPVFWPIFGLVALFDLTAELFRKSYSRGYKFGKGR